ncbi:PIN domain-containing protein [Methyloprofundus sp.]|uniref:PIN domain-containing protein n=1 Tax=Methyloprofundus sp. TaxID=2020875 RepID=UPI003D100D39
MKVLFDTNIILDVLLNRTGFVDLSARLVGAVENKEIEGFLCATTITTLDYLLTKAKNREKARIEICKLLSLFQIASVNTVVLELAIHSDFKDFEDAVQYYSGESIAMDGLVTRNPKDFKQALLPVYTPQELWGIIGLQ